MTSERSGGAAIEYLDRPELDPVELRTSLADVARLNRLFGGTRAIVAEMSRLVKQGGIKGEVRVLDLGTGSGDIPRALVRWGSRRGLSVRILACDRHAQIARVAKTACSDVPAISILMADALRLPFPTASFDFVTCSLMVHHLAEEEAVALLREMKRVSRRALIVSDLVRSQPAYLGVWLGVHLTCRSRITRHDGPLSVRRAYTLAELRRISAQAGCEKMNWRRRPSYRMVGVMEA